MKPKTAVHVLIAAVTLVGLAGTVSADVKTREKTLVSFEGVLGGIMNRFSGQGEDGVTSTVAVSGSRKASMNERTGQVIDLAEEKVYEVDVRRKEYRVTTFEEMRERLRQAQADAEKQAEDMPDEDKQDLEEAGKEIEIDLDVKETGARRQVAGYDTRQVIVTVTMREKGMALEQSGGMVMTTDSWIGPRIAAVDEIRDFDMKYMKAVYGDQMASLQQMGALAAMYPGLQKLMARAAAESDKLDGTPLMTTMTIETVKNAAQMQAQAEEGGGGGLAGRLARRAMRKRDPEPRSKLMTSTHELLSVDTSASAADVAIPAGFTLRQ